LTDKLNLCVYTYSDRTVKWTFEIQGVFDDAHDIPLTIPEKLKGVEISTLTAYYERAVQSAMSRYEALRAHSVVKQIGTEVVRVRDGFVLLGCGAPQHRKHTRRHLTRTPMVCHLRD
jgi:hypothetical protein